MATKKTETAPTSEVLEPTVEVVEGLQQRISELESQHRNFKAKVVQVAKREAKTHNWCHVVDRALDEIGLGPKWQLQEVEILVPIKIKAEFDMNLYDGDSTVAVNEIVNGLLKSIPYSAHSVIPGLRMNQSAHKMSVNGQIEVLKTEKVVPPPPTSTVGMTLHRGYILLYTSNQGRVKHIVNAANAAEARRNRSSALCGDIAYYSRNDWVENTATSPDRLCVGCEKRGRAQGIITSPPPVPPSTPNGNFSMAA